MNSVVKPIVEYRAMPSLLESRNALIQEMETLINTVKTETRSMNGREANRFEQIKKEVQQIDKTLQAEQTANSFETRGYNATEKEEIRQFVQYVKTGQYEGRDLSSGQSGSVIPRTVESMVISKIKELAPIFERMTHYNVTGSLSIPSYGWDSHSVAWVEDFQTIASSGGTFLTVDLESHALASLALIGKNLINRTDIDVVSIIVEQIAMAIANFINNEIINGTTVSGNLKSVTQTQTAAGAAAVAVDDLISLQMKVPSIFQEDAAWLMHPNTFLSVRKLKDTAGNPLLLNGNQSLGDDLGFTLLGKPVLLDENMGGVAATSRSIYYGDFSGLVCNQNAPLRTQILLERYIDVNATGVITSMDFDISLAQSRALAALVHP